MKTPYSTKGFRTRFNDLAVGTVFELNTYTLVKLRDAVPGVRPHMQRPDSICLSNSHYTVVGSEAMCRIIKTMDDSEYAPNKYDDMYDFDD